MITLPRPLLVGIASAFSLYSACLGALSAMQHPHPGRVIAAIVLFVAGFLASVLIGRTVAMPNWLGGLNVGIGFTISLLVTSDVAPSAHIDYMTWYVGAVGCLLTVSMVRKQALAAWIGVALLTAHTLLWAGPLAITRFGVLADVLWVTVAWAATHALARAMRDVRQFARAEREAVEWQAAQDAHHFERQVRLSQTSRVALPMLRIIAAKEGDIDEDDRAECRVLEQTIRDEIRGRRLLNDAVRSQVIAHRRRGAFVQVLDDGGLDDIDPAVMDPVLDRVAAAIEGIPSDRIIIRTAPKDSEKAVTVVGLTTDETAAALGLEGEDHVDVWLEIERPALAGAVRR